MRLISNKSLFIPKNIAFGVRKVWAIFCIGFIVSVLIIEGLMAWYFALTINRFDSPVTASVQTNGSKIRSINKTIDSVEGAIKSRTENQINSSAVSSQNVSQVIE